MPQISEVVYFRLQTDLFHWLFIQQVQATFLILLTVTNDINYPKKANSILLLKQHVLDKMPILLLYIVTVVRR
jgi:hypothetical protein